MNRKRLGYLVFGGGATLALIVGALVYGQVAAARQVIDSLPTARVLVATADIPARTEIAASMVSVQTVPDDLVQVGAATSPEDVVGKFTPDPILKGEVINTNRIGPAAARNAPSYTIEKGKVMYVMPVSFGGNQFSIAQINALRPGDRVDLLYTTVNIPQGVSTEERDAIMANPIPYLQTRIMLQDLRIQEIGTYGADGKLIPAGGSIDGQEGATPLTNANIIFIVSPEEALVLKWLKDAATYYRESNMEMVLRSPADEGIADNNLVVNFNYMREKYNLAPAPPTVNTNGG